MKQIALAIGLARAPHASRASCAGAERGGARAPAVGWQPGVAAGLPLGPGGSGKTHLLQAVAERCASRAASAAWLDAATAEPPELRRALGAGRLSTTCTLHAGAAARGLQLVRRGAGAAARRAGRRPRAAGRPEAARGPAHAPRLGPRVPAAVLSEPERRAVLRQAADARGVFLSRRGDGLHADPLLARPRQPDAAARPRSTATRCRPSAPSPFR